MRYMIKDDPDIEPRLTMAYHGRKVDLMIIMLLVFVIQGFDAAPRMRTLYGSLFQVLGVCY